LPVGPQRKHGCLIVAFPSGFTISIYYFNTPYFGTIIVLETMLAKLKYLATIVLNKISVHEAIKSRLVSGSLLSFSSEHLFFSSAV
jgi:hypothetical protein